MENEAINVQEVVESKTLHDTVEAAFEEHSEKPVEPEVKPEVTPEVAPDIDIKRERDDQGRFVSKPEEPLKEEQDLVVKPAEDQSLEDIGPPSSWKPDRHELWKTFSREQQEQLTLREGQFASGVSTYKAEADHGRPLVDAIAPFMDELTQNNIDPGHWISSLGNAHFMLAKGTPDQKLSMFLKLANDYQVPVQNLFTQGEDKKLYFNPQVQPHQTQQPDVDDRVEQKMAEINSRNEIDNFSTTTDTSGNPTYPHYETVRETMAQLLESGLADDLNSAYKFALKHPIHADLYDSIAKQASESEKAEQLRKIKAETDKAKSNAVSRRTATPASNITEGTKGIRGAIEDAFDKHATAGRI